MFISFGLDTLKKSEPYIGNNLIITTWKIQFDESLFILFWKFSIICFILLVCVNYFIIDISYEILTFC